MSRCPNCGTEFQPGQLFCSECGTRLPQEQSADSAPAPVFEPEPVASAEPAAPAARTYEPVPPAPSDPFAAQGPASLQGEFTPSAQSAKFSSAPGAPVSGPAPQDPAPRVAPVPVPPAQNSYGQPNCAPNAAPQANAVPDKKSPYAPVSTGAFYGTMFLFAIPVVGLIFAIVWACGGCRKKNLRNYALASILYGLTGVLLSVILCFTLWFAFRPVIVEALGDLGYVLVDGQGNVINTEGSESSSQTVQPEPVEGSALDKLRQMTSGDFSIRYKVDMFGMELEGIEARKGDQVLSGLSFPGIFEQYTLKTGGTCYIYEKSQKIYCVTEDEPTLLFDLSPYDAEVVARGTDTFNGQQLPFESFSSSYGETLSIFLRNGVPCGMRADADDELTDVLFTEISVSPSDDLFRLPDGCTEVSEDTFYEETFDF